MRISDELVRDMNLDALNSAIYNLDVKGDGFVFHLVMIADGDSSITVGGDTLVFKTSICDDNLATISGLDQIEASCKGGEYRLKKGRMDIRVSFPADASDFLFVST